MALQVRVLLGAFVLAVASNRVHAAGPTLVQDGQPNAVIIAVAAGDPGTDDRNGLAFAGRFWNHSPAVARVAQLGPDQAAR